MIETYELAVNNLLDAMMLGQYTCNDSVNAQSYNIMVLIIYTQTHNCCMSGVIIIPHSFHTVTIHIHYYTIPQGKDVPMSTCTCFPLSLHNPTITTCNIIHEITHESHSPKKTKKKLNKRSSLSY